MRGPGDEAAAGRSMRASDADRDQAVDVLKAAFVQGRLAKDEFGLRVGQALAALTCAELDALTADVPAGPTPQGPPVAATRVQVHRRNPVAPNSSSDRRSVPELILIARMVRTRRRLIFFVTGMLLLGAGMALPSTVAFISGMLVVASSAPQALPSTSETATVRMWQWLYRRQADHPGG